MNPLAKKNASAMSHGIGSPKAENAAEKVRVLVRTEAPNPINATAPSGSGWVMIPTIVARKIASSCHAFLETPDGSGTNQRIIPVAIEARRGLIAAPCQGFFPAGAAGAPAAAAVDDALTVNPRADLANLENPSEEETSGRIVPKPAVLRGRAGREEHRLSCLRMADFGIEARDLREVRAGEEGVVERARDAMGGRLGIWCGTQPLRAATEEYKIQSKIYIILRIRRNKCGE